MKGSKQYIWKPATDILQKNDTLMLAFPKSTTTYSITGTDQYNCRKDSTFNIKVNPLPLVDVYSDITPRVCRNTTLRVKATGAKKYTWIPTTALKAVLADSSKVDATPTIPITYRVWGRDSLNCKNFDDFTIQVDTIPTVKLIKYKDCLSTGDTLILNAGEYNAVYSWWLAQIGNNTNLVYKETDDKDSKFTVHYSNYKQSVKVYVKQGVCATINDKIIIEPCCKIDIPTAFTPNHDGVNEIIRARGSGVQIFNFIIFNRLGKRVFESKDISTGWDGTCDGKDQPMDVYTYYMYAKMADDTIIEKQGTITLLR